jgi:hypothetical protein
MSLPNLRLIVPGYGPLLTGLRPNGEQHEYSVHCSRGCGRMASSTSTASSGASGATSSISQNGANAATQVCRHQKTGICEKCDVCKKCRSDECMELTHAHPTGPEGITLRAKRKAYWSQSESVASAKSSRRSAPKAGDLREAEVQEVLRSETPPLLPSEVPARLDMSSGSVSGRLLERKSAFDAQSLANPVTCDLVRNSIEKVQSHICNIFGGFDDEVASMIRALAVPAVPDPESGLAVLGDAFLRAPFTCNLSARRSFAYLIRAVPDKSLCERMLTECQLRAMTDAGLNATFRQTFGESQDLATVLSRRCRWIHSRVRRSQAIQDLNRLNVGLEILPVNNKCRVSAESMQNALLFIETHSHGRKAGYARSIEVGPCYVGNVPVLNSCLLVTEMWDLYLAESRKHPEQFVLGAPRIGRESFHKLFNGVATITEEKHSLSYYYTGAVSALNDLTTMLTRLETLWTQHSLPESPADNEVTALLFDFEHIKGLITHMKDNVIKYILRRHVTIGGECDGNLLHCGRRAIGLQCDKSEGEHNTDSCSDCWNFSQVALAVKAMANAVANTLGRQHNDAGTFARNHNGGPVHEALTMMRPIVWSMRSLNLYHRHVVRGVLMSAEITRVAVELPVGIFLLNIDHKQKIEPINILESSEEYYGKKGMSLLGVMVRWRTEPNGPLHVRYFDLVSSNAKQDSAQVQALLLLVIPEIRKLDSQAQSFILVSDNGSAFSSSENIDFCLYQNKKGWGCASPLRVSQWLFFEAQTGKTALDTHFAFVGISLRRYARRVKAVKSYIDVMDALSFEGGIAATTTLQADFLIGDTEAGESADDAKSSKVQGIRKLHMLLFGQDSVQLFNYPGVAADVATRKAPNTVADPLQVAIFRRHENVQGRVLQQSAAQAHTPVISVAEYATPLDIMISETILDFATKPQYVSPERLQAFVVPSDADASAEATSTTGKRQKVTVVGDLTLFKLGWADGGQRESPPVPSHLKEEIEKAVSVHSVK